MKFNEQILNNRYSPSADLFTRWGYGAEWGYDADSRVPYFLKHMSTISDFNKYLLKKLYKGFNGFYVLNLGGNSVFIHNKRDGSFTIDCPKNNLYATIINCYGDKNLEIFKAIADDVNFILFFRDENGYLSTESKGELEGVMVPSENFIKNISKEEFLNRYFSEYILED